MTHLCCHLLSNFRDTYSLQNQRKMCGASNQELLPEVSEDFEWTKNITGGELGEETAGPVFQFDGVNGAVIPESVISHDFGDEFTITTWMRHEKKKGRQTKEQIMCLSDDHRKNRHHAALFVRNCKLVFLYRSPPVVTQTHKLANIVRRQLRGFWETKMDSWLNSDQF